MSLILAVVVGLIAHQNLPMQLLPDGFSPPFMFVSIPTLAASPEENELTIAKPIEDALSTLTEVEQVKTFIRTTNVGFAIDLRGDADADLAYLRIRSRLRREQPSLPASALQPFIWRHDPNDDPLFIFSVDLPPQHENPARVIQDRVARVVERIPGVSRVELQGINELAVRIQIKSQELRRARMTPQALSAALNADHFTQTAGELIEGERSLWINTSSRFTSLQALRDRLISPTTRLGDVAEVVIAPDPRPPIYRVNGRTACSIHVFKVSTENTIRVSSEVERTLSEIFANDKQLQDFKRTTFFDQGQFIQSSLDQIKDSALFGGLIAMLCLWIFLRSIGLTLMVTTAIPLCLLMTIALLYLRGQSLNILSMMGIILSVGMVIDNAIVVLEQIIQRRREGYSPFLASLVGTRSIALAVTLATSTTLVVFIPLMMANDQPMLGFFIQSIGEPVCYALGTSLLVALIHLPTLSQWVGVRRRDFATQSSSEFSIASGLTDISTSQSRGEALYHKSLQWILRHRLLASAVALCFLLSAGYPSSRLQRVDKGGGAFKTLSVNVIGPLNGPQAELDTLAREIEEILYAARERLDIQTIVTAPGWSPEHLRISLYLTPQEERALNKAQREDEVMKILPQKPRFRLLLRRGMEAGVEGVNISVYGPLLGTTLSLAEQLVHRLKALPDVSNAQLELPEGGLEMKLAVHSMWAQLSQLTPSWISSSVNAEFQERPLGEMMTDRGILPILLTPEGEHVNLDEVGRSVFAPPTTPSSPPPSAEMTSLIERPLESVVTRGLELGSGKIRRFKRKVQVSITVQGEDGPVMSALERELPKVSLPIGYGIDYGERFKDRQKNEKGGFLAVLVGALLVFCLMGMLFESLLTPIAILGTIPLAFVGALWMLWFSGSAFEVMAMVGGVILVGVVVNNGIVLIDQVQELRRTGLPRDDAVLKAASTRLRPILMTALTTIGGLIPMAFLGGESVGLDYRPLGQVVIGGLISSTLLTLLMIPLFYTLLDDLSQAPQETSAWMKRLASFLLRREAS